ncbi:hypothetical protein GCM10023350_10200 [Nocardioides endophyticus]|uniref:STAS domain-containing protein n=1 Tax=Nocardioides endophyticus TaxID=1353775 RepID=A0ABP8YIV0_9ACTN
MPDLYLNTHQHHHAVHVTLVGPLNARTAPRLRAELNPHSSTRVQLHMRDCTGIDLDGLFALSLAHTAAAEAGGSLDLADVPPLIAHYLHDHHADHLLEPPSAEQP